MRTSVFAGLAAGLLTAGCAADSPVLQQTLVMPSGYDPLDCKEIVAKYKTADGRLKELTTLMEKSGSALTNAIAYDTEYATARANKQFAEAAAARKKCDLTEKPPTKPPEAPAAQPQQVETKKP
jgi:hypothetical protein